MAQVKYVGPMDTRELGAADFKKLGVEEGAKKMVFIKGEVVEVNDATAEALTHKMLGKDFQLVDEAPKADNSVNEDGESVDTPAETKLTKAQQAKVDKAAKAGVEAVSKAEALPAEAEVAQDGHPQETDSPDAGSTAR